MSVDWLFETIVRPLAGGGVGREVHVGQVVVEAGDPMIGVAVIGWNGNRWEIREGWSRGSGSEGGRRIEHRRIGDGVNILAMACELAGGVGAGEDELLRLRVGSSAAAAAAFARVDGRVVLETEEAVDRGGVGRVATREAVQTHAANRAIEGVHEPSLRF